MVAHINEQRRANESLGGVFEVRAFGLVPGLGSHVSWEERLDGRLAGALCSIQAIKGVGLGDGFALAATPGSLAHDEIFHDPERGYYRVTNHAGGLEGGMTTGDPLIAQAAMKPLPTLTKPLRSVDIATLEPAEALRERTDSCTVPAAGVVGEAMVALVLADAYRAEVRRRSHRRRARRARRLPRAHRMDALSGPTARAPAGSRARAPDAVARARLHRLHGRRQVDRGRELARALGRDGVDTDRLLEERFGHSIARRLRAPRRGRLPRRRGAARLSSCWMVRDAGAPCISLGGGSRALRAGAARRSAATSTVLLDVDAAQAWERVTAPGAEPRPLAADRERLRGAPSPAPSRCTRSWPTRSSPPTRAVDAARVLPALRAADARRPPATPPGAGAIAASGDYPVFVGRGLLGRRLVAAATAAHSRRFCVTDETVAALYGRAARG